MEYDDTTTHPPTANPYIDLRTQLGQTAAMLNGAGQFIVNKEQI